MSIRLKSPAEIQLLEEGGKLLAKVMAQVVKATQPGVSAKSLDDLANRLIKEYGGKPSFLNYQPDFSSQPFPNTLCVSVNEVIVHGIPSKNLILKDGDLVSLDLGMQYRGLFTDMAVTVGLGKISYQDKKLLNTTKKALWAAIQAAKPNHTLGDLGFAIEKEATKNGFVVIRDLVGHGVGYAVHEDPYVFNYGKKGTGLKLEPGLVIAIEPMLTYHTGAIKENSDGSFSTLDGKKACHFEHTIAILKDKTIIITQ